MSEIERLNMIAEWQEQHKQLIEDLDNSKKRIEELEAENAKLKMSLKVERKNKSNVFAELNDETAQSNEMLINEVADLKKENAKLKDYNKKLLQSDIDKQNEIVFLSEKVNALQKVNADLEEQLTKAKELIKKIEKIFYSGENAIKRLSEISDTLAEAEQFLKNDGCPDVMCEDCTKEDCGIKKLGLVEVEK